MISTTSVIKTLYEWRKDKLALTVFAIVMVGDSPFEAWEQLERTIPTLRDISEGSRNKRKKDRKYDVDHDTAKRVLEIAEEIEPWVKQLAEREKGIKIGSLT